MGSISITFKKSTTGSSSKYFSPTSRNLTKLTADSDLLHDDKKARLSFISMTLIRRTLHNLLHQ